MYYAFDMTARISKELEEAIIASYLAGNSSKGVSDKFGCSRSTCLEVLKRNGIKSRTPQEAHVHALAEHKHGIITAYLNGASTKEAAAQFGYHKATKSWLIRLYGTEAIVTEFSQFLRQFVNSKATIRREKSIFKVSYFGNKLVPAIVRTLYADAAIYLDRKMKLARTIIDK